MNKINEQKINVRVNLTCYKCY